MLSITILAVGGLKEKYFTDACAEYQKRLGAFCKLDIVELGEYRLGKNPSGAEIEKCLENESNAILAKLPPRSLAVSLCIEGVMLDSAGLSEAIEKAGAENPHIAFIIGSSHGLSAKVKQKSRLLLSMSRMTFPHQMARVMLLEQIYRAFSISSGHKYHK